MSISRLGLVGKYATTDYKGEIYDKHTNNLMITSIRSVADIAARDDIIGTHQEGDLVIVNDISKTFIWDGDEWIELKTPLAVSNLGDVVLTNIQNRDLLQYQSSNSRWINIAPWLTTKGDILTYDTNLVRLGVGSNNQVLIADSNQTKGLIWSDNLINAQNDIITLQGTAHTHANKANLDTINQNLNTVSNAAFNKLTITERITHILNGSITLAAGDFTYTGAWIFCDTIGNINIRTLKTDIDNMLLIDHDHSNKGYLDVINQNLSTTSNVLFNSLTATQKMYIPNNVSASLIGGEFTYYNNEFLFADNTSLINLRDLKNNSHTHSNKANLDTINQNMGTTNLVTFQEIRFDMNHLSVASAYSIYKYNNKLWLKYDSTNSTIIDQDISTTSTTFTNTYTTTNGLYLNHGTSGSSHIRIYDNDSTIITGSGSIKATFYPHTSYGMFFYTYGINVGTLSVGAMPYHLTCVGTQGSSTSTLWTSISDRRSKINVELLNDNILDEFMKINFYKFNHIYDKNKIKFGCIADEICNCCVFGDCVKAHDKICIEDVDTKEKYEIENCKDFNPEKIMFASFKVIQIQEKRIKALEDENIRLKTVIDNILTRLTNIEEDLTV